MRRRMAAINRVVTNPIQRTYAWLVPPWAVVEHTGRRSGRTYRTPVLAWKSDGRISIGILYGEESDWVRNLLAAGEGVVTRGGRRYAVSGARVVNRAELPSFAARLLTGASGRALMLDVERRI